MDLLRRTRVLGQRYLDGLASPGEVAELEGLLQADPVAADAFALLSRLEADLSAQFSEEPYRLREAAVLEAIERHHRRRLWWGRGLRLAVAAGLLLLLCGSLLWWFGQPVFVEPVMAAGNVVLEGEVLVEGQAVEHLDDGSPLVVAGPTPALLRLSDGSRAQLEPKSEAVVHGRSEGFAQRFELIAGAGQFTVWKARDPFLVDTPAGSVRTEDSVFTVRLTKTDLRDPEIRAKQGVLAVFVRAGLVQVNTDKTYRLSARESREFVFRRVGDRVPEKRPASLVAVISEIKDGKLTVTVSRRSSLTHETLDVPASVRVFVDGKRAKRANLAKGMAVRIEKNDKGELVAIAAEGPSIAGKVKAITPRQIILVGRGEDTSYKVTPKVMVVLDRSKPGRPEDVKAGMEVVLKLSADGKTVLTIARREYAIPLIRGQIKAVDLKANTITLTGTAARSSLRQGEERTFTLGKAVPVMIDGKRLGLADLKPGTEVMLGVDRDGNTVVRIGTLIAVPAGRRQRDANDPRREGQRERDGADEQKRE